MTDDDQRTAVAVALFSPWARVMRAASLSAAPGHMTITIYAPFLSGVRLLTRADTAGARLLRALFPPLFYAYIALGTLLALSLAIWRGRLARRARLIACALWLSTLLVMLVIFSAQLASGHGADAYLQITRRTGVTATAAPAVCLWLGWLAVALGGAGLFFVVRARRRAGGAATGSGRPAPTRPAGAWRRRARHTRRCAVGGGLLHAAMADTGLRWSPLFAQPLR